MIAEMISLKKFVVNWADRAESALKKGCRLDPPGEIFDYLGMLLVFLVAEIYFGNSSFDFLITFP
jgi:hypothetical protein